MPHEAETRYRQVLETLGTNRRWYQLGSDDYFAAVIAAVDDVAPTEIVERDEHLHEVLSAGNDLHLIRRSLAAITAVRGLDIELFVSASEQVAETLRPATRTKRFRRVAGTITIASGRIEFDVLGNRAISLYEAWQHEHRISTVAGDIVLAVISETLGIDPATALDRARSASNQLAASGYEGAWEVARILCLDDPEASVPRFLTLADLMRGRRKRLSTDRRSAIAIAALAQHPPDLLAELVSERLRAIRVKRWQPDSRIALSIAALLTLGASVSSTHQAYPAFHGFVLREHYLASYREANAG
ncbi:MAG: hypothetical protein HKO10_02425 [Acidimicrobiia bacterium]|nr:hypothetical protein [Acidimicrobiia bacterium]